jgi:hypothetical protein
VFFIGGSFRYEPRESSRGRLDRHFNFNRERDYAPAGTELARSGTATPQVVSASNDPLAPDPGLDPHQLEPLHGTSSRYHAPRT